MSLFYGFAAALFVSGTTWAAMSYLSQLAGICLGLFLLTFFVVSAVYLTGDDLVERQKTVLKAMTNTEVVFFERLRDIEFKVNALASAPSVTHTAVSALDLAQALDSLLLTLDDILAAPNPASLSTDDMPVSMPWVEPNDLSVHR